MQVRPIYFHSGRLCDLLQQHLLETRSPLTPVPPQEVWPWAHQHERRVGLNDFESLKRVLWKEQSIPLRAWARGTFF